MFRNQEKESECRTSPTVSTPLTYGQPQQQAFSRADLCVIVAVAGILSCLMLQAQTDDKTSQQELACVKNLRQIYVAFKTWALDNSDRFPMAVSKKDGGSMEFVAGGNAFRHFQVMSNELADPQALICPTDHRKPAENFGRLMDTNVSYFVGVDANEKLPHMWLTGDRNLTLKGVLANAGLVSLGSTDPVGWGDDLHIKKGNLLTMGAGLLPTITEPRMRALLRLTGTNVNRLAFP
jgi:hypothetical protein